MSVLTKTSLTSLNFAHNGGPFVQFEVQGINTFSLNFAYLGQPFVAIPPFNIYVNVSGTWKQANAVYVNVAGTWKPVTTASANVSGTWKA